MQVSMVIPGNILDLLMPTEINSLAITGIQKHLPFIKILILRSQLKLKFGKMIKIAKKVRVVEEYIHMQNHAKINGQLKTF